MKILLTILLLISPFLSKEESPTYSGHTHWIDGRSGEAQYEEDSVYNAIGLPIYVLEEGNRYEVQSFEFIYKEVGVYENAQGKLEVMSDTRVVECKGNKINTDWQTALRDRLAWGDTLMFSEVRYKKGKGVKVAAPLKVYMYMPEKLRK